VELAGGIGKASVADTFDCVVVEVFEPNVPGLRERFGFDCEAVILGSDIAALEVWRGWVDVLDRLVLGAVAEFQLVCLSTCGESHDLSAETDAENWFFEGEGFADNLAEGCEDCRVTGAVTEEDAVEIREGWVGRVGCELVGVAVAVFAGGDEVVVPWSF